MQQVLNGLTLGGIYSLVALGLTLVYGILAVPNFAHGAFYMVGAFVSFYLMSRLGLNYWLAMIGSGLAVAVLAILAERLVFNPLRKSSELHPMLAAIGPLLF
ncbi:branched-chain amino acid ABC transporter permease, partial [Klebsiella pneumoniae]|nr:branched-chain amino acid ABC transporter permease [Klebsiella pneumoniae]